MKLLMEIDKIAGMMERGRMTVIAGRPSEDKTSFVLNLLADVAPGRECPLSVAMFRMAMIDEQLRKRLLHSEEQVSGREFTDSSIANTDWNKITSAAALIKNAKIFIDPSPYFKILELRVKARSLRRREPIGLIIMDYLQPRCGETLSKSKTMQIEVTLISLEIKSLAVELDVPILVLAQMGRDTELRRDPRPGLSEFRRTGTIGEDADMVAFLHRDIRENDNASEEEKRKGLYAELIIGKNRYGETGTVPLLYFPDTMTFIPD